LSPICRSKVTGEVHSYLLRHKKYASGISPEMHIPFIITQHFFPAGRFSTTRTKYFSRYSRKITFWVPPRDSLILHTGEQYTDICMFVSNDFIRF